ncbi:MAG: hypothetical protein MRY74_08200 [Neomegalonema sp.]|nr:hypothetical protein [Neomegalonema sp.]
MSTQAATSSRHQLNLESANEFIQLHSEFEKVQKSLHELAAKTPCSRPCDIEEEQLIGKYFKIYSDAAQKPASSPEDLELKLKLLERDLVTSDLENTCSMDLLRSCIADLEKLKY